MEKIEKPDSHSLRPLIDLIHSLRGESGCPWDQKQTPESISRYLVEEAHELNAAVANGQPEDICAELGDVLFHIIFMAHLFNEAGQFNLSGIIAGNVEKMVRRHPHVFANKRIENTTEIRAQWNRIKRQEKKNQLPASASMSVLDSIPSGLPALMRAYRVSERAAGTGFDWDNLGEVIEKVEEEWGEFKSALSQLALAESDGGLDRKKDDVQLEFGDMIFTLVNVARFAHFHPDTAVAAAIRKFEKRFRWMEQAVASDGNALEDTPREDLERLWAKAKERDAFGDN